MYLLFSLEHQRQVKVMSSPKSTLEKQQFEEISYRNTGEGLLPGAWMTQDSFLAKVYPELGDNSGKLYPLRFLKYL